MTSQNWTKDGITQTTPFAYDALNRQTQSGSQTSTYYGASGLRKTGIVNGTETTFIHDGNTCISAGSTNYFVPGSSPLWEAGGAGANSGAGANGGAGADGGGAITTYGMERGHVTAMVNGGGVATRFNYDAFGNMTAKTFGSTTVDKSSSGPRYNSYYLDAGSSLSTDHYATGWRPYRPDIGRFSSLDPAGSPNGPNRYNYCGSDPVNQSDPTGTKIYLGKIELDDLDIEEYYKNGTINYDERVELHGMVGAKRVWNANSLEHLLQMAGLRKAEIAEATPNILQVAVLPLSRVDAIASRSADGFKGAARDLVESGHENLGQGAYFIGFFMETTGSAVNLNKQAIIAGQEVHAAVQNGVEPDDAAIMAFFERMPIANLIIAGDELVRQESANGFDIGKKLNGFDNGTKIAGVVAQGAGASASMLGGTTLGNTALRVPALPEKWNLLNYQVYSEGFGMNFGNVRARFRGTAAKNFDWEHIEEGHLSSVSRPANSRQTVFSARTSAELKSQVTAAWANRKLVQTQVDKLGTTKMRYQGYDPVSNQTVEFWYNASNKIVESAYPIQ